MNVDLLLDLKGHKPLLALSGGVDSMVLAHLLIASGIPFYACHVEHGIRGEASRADADFVRMYCRKMGVPLLTFHLNVPRMAKERRMGLEEAARTARYMRLHEAMCIFGCDVLLTAHHKGDQAETILMHIARGAGLAGLRGMDAGEGSVLRPLLAVSRREIELYAHAQGLPFVLDRSNLDNRYTRNYVRNRVLPMLMRVNPRIEDALCRLGAQAQRDDRYLASLAKAAFADHLQGNALLDVRALDPAISARVVQLYLQGIGKTDLGSSDVQAVLELMEKEPGKQRSVGKHTLLRTASGVVPYIQAAQDDVRHALNQEGETVIPGVGKFVCTMSNVPEALDLGHNAQALDAEKLSFPLTIAFRKPGLRVQPLGGGSKLLSDVLIDKKVERHMRDRVPLIFSGETLVWIAGILPLRPARIDADTRQVCIIQFEQAKE